MTTLFSQAGSVLGSLRPAPLTIINPKAFDSFYDINNQILLDSAKSIVGGIINTAIDTLYSNNDNTVSKLVLQQLSNTLINSIFEVNNINNDTLDYFAFRINPNRLSKRRKKITTQKYTGGGWDMDIRGEELIVYSYNGSSGSMVAVEVGQKMMSLVDNFLKNNNLYDGFLGNITDYLIYNPKLSSAYLKMILFEAFWKANNDDLLIVFEDNAYLGKLNAVEFSQDAMNPYQINYNFDFIVYPEFNYNVNTGWITSEEDIKMRKRYNRIITKPIQNNVDNNSIIEYELDDKSKKIDEKQILFDVVYNDIVSEMTRRYKMAKFYAGNDNKENSLVSGGKTLTSQIGSSLGLSKDILEGDIIWLDGNTVNGAIASTSIQNRIKDKTLTTLYKEQLIKEGTMDKDTQYITNGDNTRNDDKISPQEMATKYTKLSGIDIFEDAINFNLKKESSINKKNQTKETIGIIK